MARLLRIENCTECPFAEETSGDALFNTVCTRKLDAWYQNPLISCRTFEVPDWCPLPEADGWIPVGERLPETNEHMVLAAVDLDDDQYIALASYGQVHGWRDDYDHAINGDVTHWQPLPSLPEAEEATDADR